MVGFEATDAPVCRVCGWRMEPWVMLDAILEGEKGDNRLVTKGVQGWKCPRCGEFMSEAEVEVGR